MVLPEQQQGEKMAHLESCSFPHPIPCQCHLATSFLTTHPFPTSPPNEIQVLYLLTNFLDLLTSRWFHQHLQVDFGTRGQHLCWLLLLGVEWFLPPVDPVFLLCF